MQSRIQSYLRVVAPTGRDELQVGPFQATFHPKSTNPYLNYAIPRDAAEPTQPEVAAREAPIGSGGVGPAWNTSAGPRVEQALLARGFQIEGRLPLMAFGGSDIVKVQPPEGIDLVIPTTDEDLYAMATVQAEAYGEEVPDLGIVADRRTALDHGSLAMVARNRHQHRGGRESFTDSRWVASEIAGIGVIPAQRRRGIATALAQRLAFELMTRGADLPWLMAAGTANSAPTSGRGSSSLARFSHFETEPCSDRCLEARPPSQGWTQGLIAPRASAESAPSQRAGAMCRSPGCARSKPSGLSGSAPA